MTIYEAIGDAWIIFTSILGSVAIVYGAIKHYQDQHRLAKRGLMEELLDVKRALDIRLQVEKVQR